MEYAPVGYYLYIPQGWVDGEINSAISELEAISLGATDLTFYIAVQFISSKLQPAIMSYIIHHISPKLADKADSQAHIESEELTIQIIPRK